MDRFIYQPLPCNVPPVFALHAERNRVFFNAGAQPSPSEAAADQKTCLACIQKLLRNSLCIYKGARLNTASVGALTAFERVFFQPRRTRGLFDVGRYGDCNCDHLSHLCATAGLQPDADASRGFSWKVILSKLPCNVALHR